MDEDGGPLVGCFGVLVEYFALEEQSGGLEDWSGGSGAGGAHEEAACALYVFS